MTTIAPSHSNAPRSAADLIWQMCGSQSHSALTSHLLSYNDAAQLQRALDRESRDYLKASSLSIATACSLVNRQHYAWAVPCLYYSTYYAVSALLASRGTIVVYCDRKPYTLSATPLAKASKRSGTSHEACFKAFVETAPGHTLLSQEIDLKLPPLWMKEQRERSSYGTLIANDPRPPVSLDFLHENGLRKCISIYIDPSNNYLAFDVDHACLAFPLLAIKTIASEVLGATECIAIDSSHLLRACSDSNGAISSLVDILTGSWRL